LNVNQFNRKLRRLLRKTPRFSTLEPALDHVTQLIVDICRVCDGLGHLPAQELAKADAQPVHRDSEGTFGHAQTSADLSVMAGWSRSRHERKKRQEKVSFLAAGVLSASDAITFSTRAQAQ
jgi:hypothetical protein